MKLTLDEKNTSVLLRSLNKNMQFGAVVVIYKAERYDAILIYSNVHQYTGLLT